MKKVWDQKDKWLFGGAIILAFGLSALRHFFGILTSPTYALWILLILNGAFSIYAGVHVAHQGRHWWELLVFPVLFLGALYFFLPKYAIYFPLMYLCLSYLSYGLNKATTES